MVDLPSAWNEAGMMIEVMQARGAGEEDMDVEQIDIRALERVSPRTSLMAPEQVLRSPTALP